MVGLHNLYWYYGSQTYKKEGTDKLVHTSEAFQGLVLDSGDRYWAVAFLLFWKIPDALPSHSGANLEEAESAPPSPFQIQDWGDRTAPPTSIIITEKSGPIKLLTFKESRLDILILLPQPCPQLFRCLYCTMFNCLILVNHIFAVLTFETWQKLKQEG